MSKTEQIKNLQAAAIEIACGGTEAWRIIAIEAIANVVADLQK